MKGRFMKKQTALLIIIIMLLNMFAPFEVLLNKTQAVTDILPDPLIVVNKISNITTKGANKIFKVQVAVVRTC